LLVYGPNLTQLFVSPGPIEDTEGIARLLPPAQKDALVRRIPLKSMGTIRDIELATLYLASDAARLGG
jgi:peroxisomal 2,4-dienoyl-CoA reductase